MIKLSIKYPDRIHTWGIQFLCDNETEETITNSVIKETCKGFEPFHQVSSQNFYPANQLSGNFGKQ